MSVAFLYVPNGHFLEALLVKMMLPVIAVLSLTAVAGVCHADDKREEKPRFKGVELYSWKDKSGNWTFVLLDGTNRLKKEGEVKAAKNQVKGVEKLKKAIAQLAAGEQVFWMHSIEGFEFPPAAIRKEIEQAARAAKIDFVTAAIKD